MDTDKISKFWNWFKTISTGLLANHTDENLISVLDEQVGWLGDVDWEIGPWKENTLYFAISPNLDIDKLDFTRLIIALAPESQGWKFLSSKPPKEWNGIWEMENETGKTILIDTCDWEYILWLFDDAIFDIDIRIPNVDGNKYTQYIATDIALTGYLGEETFMNLIHNVNIVDEFDETNAGKATSIKNIKKHIESIE
jgi:hypothetical protein